MIEINISNNYSSTIELNDELINKGSLRANEFFMTAEFATTYEELTRYVCTFNFRRNDNVEINGLVATPVKRNSKWGWYYNISSKDITALDGDLHLTIKLNNLNEEEVITTTSFTLHVERNEFEEEIVLINDAQYNALLDKFNLYLTKDAVDFTDKEVNIDIDGSPKGVYANLSALQTAFPSGASGVYITEDDGYWNYWNGTEWKKGAVYQSSEDIKQIKEELVELDKRLGKKSDLSILCNINGYINKKDDIVGDSSYTHSDFIRVLKDDVIIYRLRAGAGHPMIAVYDDNEVFSLENSVTGNGGPLTGTYNVLYDGYIRLSTLDTVKECILLRVGITTDVSSLQSDVSSLQSDVSSLQKNEFTIYSNKNEIGFLKANGTVQSNSGYRTTPIGLKVYKDDTIKYKLKILLSTLPIICLYSDNECKTKIDSVLGAENEYVEGTYTATEDGYIRFCYVNSAKECYVSFKDEIADNVRLAIDNAIPEIPVKKKISIAIFGDSIIGNDGEIVQYLNNYDDFSAVYNCAFGGTSISNRTSTSDYYRYFDGESLWSAITTGVYTNQDANISKLSNASQNHWNTIKSLNFNNIDLIVLGYGTNDYTQKKELSTIINAYNSVFTMIRRAFPKTRILVLSPIWRLISYDETQSRYIDSDEKIYATNTLKEIADGIIDNCKNNRVSVFDGYSNVQLCIDSVPTFFDNVTVNGDEDSQTGIEVPIGSGQYYSGVHLNADGNKMYSQLIHGAIMSIF